MGGIAFRAPVLATLFLIVALANLAMPGSSNFVGEFLILLGVFDAKIVIAIVAFAGVVLASVYTLRLFIRAMHNRVGPHVDVARDLRSPTGCVIAPLVAVILAFALYPQLALERSEASVKASIATPRAIASATEVTRDADDAQGSAHRLGRAVAAAWRCWAAPRSCSCSGCCARARCARSLVPLLALVALRAPPSGWAIWQWGEQKDLIAGALRARRPDDRALVRLLRRRRGGGAAVVARGRAARGGPRRVLRAAADLGRRHVGARRARRTW